jgi:uncharacterized protein with HEPN domain
MRRDLDRLADIAEAAQAIGGFITGFDASSFASNDLVRSAVFAKLIIIGQAARILSKSFLDAHPDIP